MTAAPVYSAAQFAAALGVSARGVKKRLVSIPAAGRTFARGQQAFAWTLEQLPAAMRDELAAKARQGCYRDTGHLLADPGAPWQPTIDGQPVTLAEVAEHCIVEATKLERAPAPTLKCVAVMPPLPAAEIETRGLAEYKAEFGKTIHPKKMAPPEKPHGGPCRLAGNLSIGDVSSVQTCAARDGFRRAEVAPCRSRA